MKIAVIGSGISGLLSARLLTADHDIHVFEVAFLKTRIRCLEPFFQQGALVTTVGCIDHYSPFSRRVGKSLNGGICINHVDTDGCREHPYCEPGL